MDPWEKKKWLVVLGIVLCCVAGGLWQSRSHPPEPQGGQAQVAVPRSEKKAKVTIYISGAVQNPGLYQVEPGIRYQEALEVAGGATEEADLTRVNLAKKCKDGSQVNVPFLKKGSRRSSSHIGTASGGNESRESAGSGSGEAMSASSPGGKVNLNTADEAQLTTLPGIGSALARRIILYRQQKPFQRVEDLQQVSGIGPAKFRRLADQVEV